MGLDYVGPFFKELQNLFLIQLTGRYERSVWDILWCKLVNVVCEVFSRTNYVDRELMRGTDDGV